MAVFGWGGGASDCDLSPCVIWSKPEVQGYLLDMENAPSCLFMEVYFLFNTACGF